MSRKKASDEQGEQPRWLRVSVERVDPQGEAVEMRVRLRNQNPQRALHYVSEVRGIVFDSTAGRFVIRLTDEGRELIPGALGRLPAFGQIDPGASSLLTLRLPPSIVRMRTPATPTSEVVLEEHRLEPNASYEVVIGWSDTPYYPDPRGRGAETGLTQVWEQHRARGIGPG